jgi:hypothetical protein
MPLAGTHDRTKRGATKGAVRLIKRRSDDEAVLPPGRALPDAAVRIADQRTKSLA